VMVPVGERSPLDWAKPEGYCSSWVKV